jgi:hypothetical protein
MHSVSKLHEQTPEADVLHSVSNRVLIAKTFLLSYSKAKLKINEDKSSRF